MEKIIQTQWIGEYKTEIGVEQIIELIRQNKRLCSEIDRTCIGNRECVRLLCDILLTGATAEKEIVTAKIYQYGSMIRKQDLMGRQIFLWLSQMIWNI